MRIIVYCGLGLSFQVGLGTELSRLVLGYICMVVETVYFPETDSLEPFTGLCQGS